VCDGNTKLPSNLRELLSYEPGKVQDDITKAVIQLVQRPPGSRCSSWSSRNAWNRLKLRVLTSSVTVDSASQCMCHRGVQT
jgi:hypothetical protein